jgi:hypothetical protein
MIVRRTPSLARDGHSGHSGAQHPLRRTEPYDRPPLSKQASCRIVVVTTHATRRVGYA